MLVPLSSATPLIYDPRDPCSSTTREDLERTRPGVASQTHSRASRRIRKNERRRTCRVCHALWLLASHIVCATTYRPKATDTSRQGTRFRLLSDARRYLPHYRCRHYCSLLRTQQGQMSPFRPHTCAQLKLLHVYSSQVYTSRCGALERGRTGLLLSVCCEGCLRGLSLHAARHIRDVSAICTSSCSIFP